ncbi:MULTISPECIES: NAD(P)/FAD-dependent oxidoreductase [unclassified Mycolicibacterium]|uniref:flavin monoamine oxidase family protein n=1 Tax=unclassified Mycolicibacterium TaxID=2636767 RepID=UPI0012DE10A1|nr:MULTISPECIES: NAD(P)/FAD-dependent oxidoreductase [unclassified Mycolicibacterium]MUL81641.1 NAD(P)-binding protein [Mycolicibacterium sp. CBMA 329]MUL87407.1 NAD(P)-binding protein [Mycolicibacterium sp. CBMA 331]MUL99727.1 NAD(P)-binding protein [Mycolicibacterium sp. CBMA 334]MUM25362.1 NAD(P)-binding protein [Mycolicibacterium sp. CBMA 295]MUM37704.1 NAD(P)-binding protein [Mycolicibacterium sp. CBMA 247]
MTSVLPGAGHATKPISIFGPDFPFEFDKWIGHPDGLGEIPEAALGQEVAVIGAGIAGMVAAHELMKLGLRPVLYESARIGGRLRSERFDGAPEDVIAELGGMRFPSSSLSFFHYVDLLGLTAKPFPNPLTPAAGSTVIDIEGMTHHAREVGELPEIFQEVARAWSEALEEVSFTPVQDAIRARDAKTLKLLWNQLITEWDDCTFYDFVASSKAFSKLSFHHREVFGQVGFGTGGWDSDFPNSMLEILRVVMTNCDEDQHLIVGGAEQVPRGLWTHAPDRMRHWPAGTTLANLHGGVPQSRVKRIGRGPHGQLSVTDQWGVARDYPAVLATCQSWLLTTEIDCDESLFSQKVWTALDRTRYMQSSKTFVLVDRPFWKDVNPATGRDTMSMTLTDRMTRGTYLFDNGDDSPAVICLTYSWMSDAMKMLPYSAQERAEMAIKALKRIYPQVDINQHIVGEPISVSWEADRNFLGAFKGALPGHYRYNHRMYSHFMQERHADAHKGIFLAGDDVSWTPAWAEGAVQTALNAVWGIMTHFGGRSSAENPGPGDVFAELGPLRLPE